MPRGDGTLRSEEVVMIYWATSLRSEVDVPWRPLAADAAREGDARDVLARDSEQPGAAAEAACGLSRSPAGTDSEVEGRRGKREVWLS